MAILKSTLVNGDLTVDGSLNVQGNLTYVGVDNLRVKDKQIELNTDAGGTAVSAGANADEAGIVIRGAKNTTKEGSEEASILYNYGNDTLVINKTIEGTVTSANNATSANKVANPLTVNVTDKTGTVTAVKFDGSAAETVNIDLKDLQDQIDSLSGGAGSVKDQIDNAISKLDAPDAAVDGQYVSAVSETDGKITVSRAALPNYSETYDAKGSAAAVLGKADDDSTVTTVYGVKAYAKKRADELAAGKADAVHTHEIGDVNGLQDALNGKAAKVHTHAITDVTGLQDALNKKAASDHNHDSVYDEKGAAAAVLGQNTDDKDTNTVYGVRAYAKAYADGLASNYDAAGAAATAKTEAIAQAKSYTDTEIGKLGNAAKKNVLTGEIADSPSSDNLVTAAQVKAYADTQDAATLASAKAYTDTTAKSAAADAVAQVVAGAPSDFDTLKEVADWIESDKTNAAALQTDVSKLKTDVSGLKTDVSGLKTDVSGLKTDVSGLKTKVSTLEGASHTHANMAELNKIEDGDKANWDGHVANANIHVTADQKAAWTAKQDALANAATLATIDSTKVSNWDDAASKAHEHANKTVLDDITADKVTAWDNAVEAAGVKSVGGKAGALTLKGGSATRGDVNLSISDTGEISAAIVSDSFDASGSAAKALTDAKTYANGLAKNYDAAGAAATAKSEVIGVNGDAADKDTIFGAKAYADVAVSALSGSVATTDAAQYAKITKIEGDITSIKGNYVQKAGDTMTGDLTMPSNGTNGIVFGDMKIVWKDNAIEFVPITKA